MNKNDAKSIIKGDVIIVKKTSEIGTIIGISQNPNKTFEFDVKFDDGKVETFNNAEVNLEKKAENVKAASEDTAKTATEVSTENTEDSNGDKAVENTKNESADNETAAEEVSNVSNMDPIEYLNPSDVTDEENKTDNPMMYSPAAKHYKVRSLAMKTMDEEMYNKMKFAAKSNIIKENAYVLHYDGNDKFNFVAGITNMNFGVGIMARNINTAKKIFNSILERTYFKK